MCCNFLAVFAGGPLGWEREPGKVGLSIAVAEWPQVIKADAPRTFLIRLKAKTGRNGHAWVRRRSTKVHTWYAARLCTQLVCTKYWIWDTGRDGGVPSRRVRLASRTTTPCRDDELCMLSTPSRVRCNKANCQRHIFHHGGRQHGTLYAVRPLRLYYLST